MSYSDLIFLLGLLPISILASFFDRSAEYKNLILIVTSVIFFAWAKPIIVCVLFITVIFDYVIGLLISKNKSNNSLFASKILLFVDLLMNGAIFFIFTHNYLFKNISVLNFSNVVFPIGIGFYAVRGFSYCYDVFKGNCKAEKNVFCLLTYMVSFHFMMVGPVVRYGQVEPYIRKREISTDDMNKGLTRLIIGLAKVGIVAVLFSKIKLAGLNHVHITTVGCWIGMLAFFAEGYFMFSGLSDMSFGMGKMNGFTYPKNYKELGVKDLFGGLIKTFNTTLIEFYEEVSTDISKRRKLISGICTIICYVAFGIWYEAKINYIIVGFIVGLIVVLERTVFGKVLNKMPSFFKFIYVFALAFLIFGGLYFTSFSGYKKWLLALVGIGTDYNLSVSMRDLLLNNIFLLIIVFISVCPGIKNRIMKKIDNYSQKSTVAYGRVRVGKTILTSVTFLVCIITLATKIV